MLNYPARIGPYHCGAGEKLLVVAGPCVIETESLTRSIAQQLADQTRDLPVQLVFKASFDKANRTSVDSYRGPGLEAGLRRGADKQCDLAVAVGEELLDEVAADETGGSGDEVGHGEVHRSRASGCLGDSFNSSRHPWSRGRPNITGR